MQISLSTLAAVLFGIFLVLAVLAFSFIVFIAIQRKPALTPPLVPDENGHFEVGGKRVTCSHCGGTKFKPQQILLNTWLLSLLRIDWLDSSSTVLTCDRCGQLTWFAQEE